MDDGQVIALQVPVAGDAHCPLLPQDVTGDPENPNWQTPAQVPPMPVLPHDWGQFPKFSSGRPDAGQVVAPAALQVPLTVLDHFPSLPHVTVGPPVKPLLHAAVHVAFRGLLSHAVSVPDLGQAPFAGSPGRLEEEQGSEHWLFFVPTGGTGTKPVAHEEQRLLVYPVLQMQAKVGPTGAQMPPNVLQGN